MKNPPIITVIFHQVKENGAKIHLICIKAQEAFRYEKRLLITVPNVQAAQYVEALLWRVPDDGFMPHAIVDSTTNEWIAIIMQNTGNVNRAPRLLNLCSSPAPLYPELEEIHDLYDETHPQKIELSRHRLRYYRENGLFIKLNEENAAKSKKDFLHNSFA